jgi:hypothetical protein
MTEEVNGGGESVLRPVHVVSLTPKLGIAIHGVFGQTKPVTHGIGFWQPLFAKKSYGQRGSGADCLIFLWLS